MCVLFVNFAQRFRLQNVTVLTMCLRSAAAALRAAARAVMGAVFRCLRHAVMFVWIVSFQTDFDHLIQPLPVKQLDHAFITSRRNLLIDRNLRDRLDAVFFRNLTAGTGIHDRRKSRQNGAADERSGYRDR